MKPALPPASTRGSDPSGFTLVELLVVIGIIAILFALLVPALAPSTARALDGDTRNLIANLENARLTAIAHRTKVRLLLPTTSDPNWGQNLALQSYLLVNFDTTSSNWIQSSKWNHLSQFTAFDPNPIMLPDLGGATSDHNVVSIRKAATTQVLKAAGATPIALTGAYIEFLANGSTDLDPNTISEVVAVTDAVVDTNANYSAKNKALRSQITIDPLTGSAIVQ